MPPGNIPVLQPLSRSTLTQQATEAIKQLILREKLACGARLPSERELSEALVVSRNIVREALSVLEADGVITRWGGKGTFVADFERPASEAVARIADHTTEASPVSRDARFALEMGALELIIQRITDAELADLTRIVDAQEAQVHAGARAIKEDIDFHVALLRATKNPILIELAPLVIDGLREGLIRRPQGLRESIDSDLIAHRTIIEALKQRDLERVRVVMRAHFLYTDFPPELVELPQAK
jgi:GntR family transcriptional repressor for pyruvate dehydrogenase complex